MPAYSRSKALAAGSVSALLVCLPPGGQRGVVARRLHKVRAHDGGGRPSKRARTSLSIPDAVSRYSSAAPGATDHPIKQIIRRSSRIEKQQNAAEIARWKENATKIKNELAAKKKEIKGDHEEMEQKQKEFNDLKESKQEELKELLLAPEMIRLQGVDKDADDLMFHMPHDWTNNAADVHEKRAEELLRQRENQKAALQFHYAAYRRWLSEDVDSKRDALDLWRKAKEHDEGLRCQIGVPPAEFSAKVSYCIGLALNREKEFAAADQAFREAIELKPTPYHQAFVSLINNLKDQEKFQDAEKDFIEYFDRPDLDDAARGDALYAFGHLYHEWAETAPKGKKEELYAKANVEFQKIGPEHTQGPYIAYDIGLTFDKIAVLKHETNEGDSGAADREAAKAQYRKQLEVDETGSHKKRKNPHGGEGVTKQILSAKKYAAIALAKLLRNEGATEEAKTVLRDRITAREKQNNGRGCANACHALGLQLVEDGQHKEGAKFLERVLSNHCEERTTKSPTWTCEGCYLQQKVTERPKKLPVNTKMFGDDELTFDLCEKCHGDCQRKKDVATRKMSLRPRSRAQWPEGGML